MHCIEPVSSFDLSIQAPCSKSIAQRILALSLCCNGKSIIHNIQACEDINAAIKIINKSGAKTKWIANSLEIISNGIQLNTNSIIECNESGLSCRLFTSLLCCQKNSFQVHGKGSLVNRSMSFFEKYFPEINVEIKTNNQKLPFEIKGPLIPKSIVVDSMNSSQYITGLIYSYLYLGAENKTITINNPVSIPYIDLSIEIAQKFGFFVKRNKNEILFTKKQHAIAREINVEGDWSAASLWLVAGALYGKIKIKGLNINSVQADKSILDALKSYGAKIEIKEKELIVEKNQWNSIEFDATDCPDLFPSLAVLCSKSNGVSKIHGVERLHNKESNRCKSIIEEFKKFGIAIWTKNNTMFIDGKCEIKTPQEVINSHNDHRIAMATSVIILGCKSSAKINNTKCVNKSYSKFYNDLNKLYI